MTPAQICEAHGGENQFFFISEEKGVDLIVVEDPQVLEILVPFLPPGLVPLLSKYQGNPYVTLISLLETQDHALMQFQYRCTKNYLIVRLGNQAVNLVRCPNR